MPSKFAVAVQKAQEVEQNKEFREEVLQQLAEIKALLYAVIPTGDDEEPEEKPTGKKAEHAKPR